MVVRYAISVTARVGAVSRYRREETVAERKSRLVDSDRPSGRRALRVFAAVVRGALRRPLPPIVDGRLARAPCPDPKRGRQRRARPLRGARNPVPRSGRAGAGVAARRARRSTGRGDAATTHSHAHRRTRNWENRSGAGRPAPPVSAPGLESFGDHPVSDDPGRPAGRHNPGRVNAPLAAAVEPDVFARGGDRRVDGHHPLPRPSRRPPSDREELIRHVHDAPSPMVPRRRSTRIEAPPGRPGRTNLLAVAGGSQANGLLAAEPLRSARSERRRSRTPREGWPRYRPHLRKRRAARHLSGGPPRAIDRGLAAGATGRGLDNDTLTEIYDRQRNDRPVRDRPAIQNATATRLKRTQAVEEAARAVGSVQRRPPTAPAQPAPPAPDGGPAAPPRAARTMPGGILRQARKDYADVRRWRLVVDHAGERCSTGSNRTERGRRDDGRGSEPRSKRRGTEPASSE